MGKRRPSGDGMIRRRESGRWEGRIVVGHKENGDSIFRYVSGDTQKEMLDKLHRDMDAYRGADLTEDSRMTLAQWLDRWLETYTAGTMRESTRRSYRTYVERYINPRLGDRVISGLTPSDIQKLYTDLLEHGRIHNHPQQGHRLSGTMVRRIHAMLHSALKAAAQAHLIARNPTEGAALPRVEDRTRRVLTKAETERFLQTVREDPVWYPFFYTELTTGLRKGELCGLQWEDFDEEAGTLAVRRTLHTQPGGTLTTGETKTYAGTRTITLPASTAELLRERQKTACTPWIFPDPLGDGGPVRPNSASYHLKRLLKAAGLPDIRFHDLRHTFATEALEHGMDVKTLSAVIGHVSAATTLDIYTHVTDQMRTQAAEKIDRRMGGKSAAARCRKKQPAKTMTDFQAQPGTRRRPGTGCVTQINDRLWEGRYSPKWPDGKKRPRNIYAHSLAECEEKLAAMIREVQAEMAAAKAELGA